MTASRGRTVALLTASFTITSLLFVACGEDGYVIGEGIQSGAIIDAGPDALLVMQLDGGADSALLPLPRLTNVTATEREDSVGIDFDPVDDALDYRVYVLPENGALTNNADGSITIENGLYRCAGLRQTLDLPNNTTNPLNAPDGGQVYVNYNWSWPAEIPPSPTLGYVYPEAGAGLVPVYAVGVHPADLEIGWRETRPKIYTTDAVARQSLLDGGGRDDGVVFYVPATASSTTLTVYHSETAPVPFGQGDTEYYFTSEDMASHAMDSTPPTSAFEVSSAEAPGTKPLMAVLYKATTLHTELAVGKERFARAASQGPGPLWHLEWSGITEPTVLVVEALATGCPYQGFLSAQALSAPPHQAFFTLAGLESTANKGEVYMNGQHDLPGASWPNISKGMSTENIPLMRTPNASPIPIARSFIMVAPKPHTPADWDWYEGFSGEDLGTITEITGCTDLDCDRWQSPSLDISADRIDEPGGVEVVSFGSVRGELVTAFDDADQDVAGKIRLTARQEANIDPDPTKFLHVAMSVTLVSTDRRYPQLLISDQDAPVQEGLSNPNNNTFILQPMLGPSMRIEAQAIHGLVNGSAWDTNNQAPEHRFVDYDHWSDVSASLMPPAEPPFEHAGIDRLTKLDLYLSSDRAYLFLDGTPANCTLLPSTFALKGAVTVTFGDVLEHEGAPDEGVCAGPRPYSFMYEHQCLETRRVWDDLAFKSGTAAPTWNAAQFPCVAY